MDLQFPHQMFRSRLQGVVVGLILLGGTAAVCGQQWKSSVVQLPAPPNNTTATSQTAKVTKKQLDVPGSPAWTDSGIDVVAGDTVAIASEGTLTLLGATVTPDGLVRSWRDVIRTLPLNSAGPGALIARIGESQAVVPLLIGTKKEFTVTRSGRLFLGINAGANDPFEGMFKTTLEITHAAQPAPNPVVEMQFDKALFDKIPRRVTDKDGGKGDMVNFVMLGPVEAVKQAFRSAGWVQVDRTKEDAVIHAVLDTLQKQTYLEMPMSELYLFGRAQDFGFAHAEPITVVQQRHHLRIWKAPFRFNGQDIWIGAATHDIGFEKDQRNNSITHKIDPDVDTERQFVHASLTEGGGVVSSTYVTPNDPLQDAKTATGGSYHSDGRVLVMQLSPAKQ